MVATPGYQAANVRPLGHTALHTHDSMTQEEHHSFAALTAFAPSQHVPAPTGFNRAPIRHVVTSLAGTQVVTVPATSSMFISLQNPSIQTTAGTASASVKMVDYLVLAHGAVFPANGTASSGLFSNQTIQSAVPYFEPYNADPALVAVCPLGTDLEVRIRRTDLTKEFPNVCVQTLASRNVAPTSINSGRDDLNQTASWGRVFNDVFPLSSIPTGYAFTVTAGATVGTTNCALPYYPATHIHMSSPPSGYFNGQSEYLQLSDSTTAGTAGRTTPEFYNLGYCVGEISNPTAAAITVIMSAHMKVAVPVSVQAAQSMRHMLPDEAIHPNPMNLWQLCRADIGIDITNDDYGMHQARENSAHKSIANARGLTQPVLNAMEHEAEMDANQGNDLQHKLPNSGAAQEPTNQKTIGQAKVISKAHKNPVISKALLKIKLKKKATTSGGKLATFKKWAEKGLGVAKRVEHFVEEHESEIGKFAGILGSML